MASAPCDKKLVVEEDIVYGFVFVFGGVAYFARNVLKSLGFRFVSDSKKWRTESGVKAEEIADLVARELNVKLVEEKRFTVFYERDAPSAYVVIYRADCNHNA